MRKIKLLKCYSSLYCSLQLNKNLSLFNNYILIINLYCDILAKNKKLGVAGMKISPVAKILKYTLYLMFTGITFLVATLPWFIDAYMSVFRDSLAPVPGYRAFVTVFLMITGTLGLWIVGEIIAMLRTVPGDPFIRRNVRALRRMGLVAVAAAALFFLKCVLYITALTVLIGALMLVCALFALTLSDIFAQAVRYKEENDLTI